MTITETPPLSATRITARRWLAGAVCLLTGLRFGLDAAVLAGVAGPGFDVRGVLLQMAVMAIVASMVLRGRRAALGIGTACLIYAIVIELVQPGGPITAWAVMLLAHHTALLGAVLALWLVGIEKPPPDRPWLLVVLGIGVLLGALAGVALARTMLGA
jgi:hypothetical protein